MGLCLRAFAIAPSIPNSLILYSRLLNKHGFILRYPKGKEDITGVFNIASGRKTSINTLANMIMDILDRKLKPIYEKPREGDIKDSYADISKARNKLCFKPSYSLEQGLKSLIENLV